MSLACEFVQNSLSSGFVIEGFSITYVGAGIAVAAEGGAAASLLYLGAAAFAMVYDGAIPEPSYGAPCSTLVNGVPVVFMAQQAEIIQNAMRQSKGGYKNVWPDKYGPPPTAKVGDTQRGPGTPHNQAKKVYRDKRPR